MSEILFILGEIGVDSLALEAVLSKGVLPDCEILLEDIRFIVSLRQYK